MIFKSVRKDRLRDRVVLITGAASGIGRALCHALGREGAGLALMDRNCRGLDSLALELKEAEVRFAMAVADIRHRDQVREGIECLVSDLGPVDILVANAGICGLSP